MVELNRQHPLRPRIAVRTAPPATSHVIDLVEAPFIYITGPVAK